MRELRSQGLPGRRGPLHYLSSERRQTVARVQGLGVVRSEMEDAIEDWMVLMLVLLDMDPTLEIDLNNWIEEAEDP